MVEQLSPQPSALALYVDQVNSFGTESTCCSAHTVISFDLPYEQSIRLAVDDVPGREAVLLAVGTYRTQLNAASLPKGLYCCPPECVVLKADRRH